MKLHPLFLSFALVATSPLFAMHLPYLVEYVEKTAPQRATQELITIFDNLERVTLRPSIKKLQDLIERGANVNAINKRGQPLLQLAIEQDYIDGVKLLLTHGANPNVTSPLKTPVLFIAINKGVPEIVRLLLDKGADPNIINAGHTPLLSAITSSMIHNTPTRRALIQHLLAHGANVNYVTMEGSTPLSIAIMHINTAFNQQSEQSIILTLLQAGADPNIDSPLNLAIHFIPNATLIALLLQAGADPHLSFKGKTPLQFVQEKLASAPEQEKNRYETIIELLKDPTNIQRIGLEKLTSEKYKVIEPVLKGK